MSSTGSATATDVGLDKRNLLVEVGLEWTELDTGVGVEDELGILLVNDKDRGEEEMGEDVEIWLGGELVELDSRDIDAVVVEEEEEVEVTAMVDEVEELDMDKAVDVEEALDADDVLDVDDVEALLDEDGAIMLDEMDDVLAVDEDVEVMMDVAMLRERVFVVVEDDTMVVEALEVDDKADVVSSRWRDDATIELEGIKFMLLVLDPKSELGDDDDNDNVASNVFDVVSTVLLLHDELA